MGVSTIYLDNNATTRPCEGAGAAAARGVSELWHNPSSVHRAGQAARHAVELARQSLARLVGGKPRDLVLCGSGTEAIDLAIRGSLAARGGAMGKRGTEASSHPGIKGQDRFGEIWTTRVEHNAVRDLVKELEETGAARVEWLQLDGVGAVDAEAFERKLCEAAARGALPSIVSVQWVNNETGVVQPVERIAGLCAARGVVFHCDATQWVGKEPTDVEKLGAALVTFSPHKFHGLKGVGCLWMRRGTRLRPVIHGTQEMGRRGGTENVPGILAAGAAAEEAMKWMAESHERERLATLRDRLEAGMLERARAAGVRAVVNGAGAARVWNTTNIGFAKLEAEALLLLLSERGVCASAGAACSSGSLEPSPVLLAMGVEPEVAHGSVRLSLSRETTGEEIERAIEIAGECLTRLARGVG